MELRYPIPKYCIFTNYVLLTTGSDPLEIEYHNIKVPKKLILEIAGKIKDNDAKCVCNGGNAHKYTRHIGGMNE